MVEEVVAKDNKDRSMSNACSRIMCFCICIHVGMRKSSKNILIDTPRARN